MRHRIGARIEGDVSESTTERLSVYLRTLEALEAAGVSTVSSRRLAESLNLNPAQIRKDLAHFGALGVRGVGYDVGALRRHLREILGLDRRVRVVIIGAGNLGMALADYPGFHREGFEILALFDSVRRKIGRASRSGVVVRDVRQLPAFARREGVDIAVIAVPAQAAQAVVDLAVEADVRAILNFSPGSIRVPDGVKVKNMDLTVSLESLSFHLAQASDAS